MKLLFCLDCGDMFSLRIGKLRTCDCGRVSGQYVDRTTAEVNGKGVSVAIGNGSLSGAIMEMYRAEGHQTTGSTGFDRGYFRDHCKVGFCWVRPHEGEGNPHTKVKKEDPNDVC